MRLKEMYTVAALSAGLFLFGGNSAFAGSPFDTVKGQFENAKSNSIKTEKIPSNFDFMKKSVSKKASVTSEPSEEPIYEKEPNDTLSSANPLQLTEVVYGTFHDFDIDTYKITITQEGLLGVGGMMEPYSLSNIGFVLFDAKEEPVEWVEYYTEDQALVISYNVTPGTYYIKAFNIGEYVTDDLYGLTTDMLYIGDVTPPEAPLVNRFDDNDTVLTGVSEPGATIEVYSNEMMLGTTEADATGRFAVLIETQPEGTELNIVAIDESGNISEYTNISVANSTFTGWVLENGNWYYYINGSKNHGWQYDNGKYYYLDLVSGEMKTGWVNDNKRWFFLDKETGAKKSGWLFDNGKWYYLDPYGVMKTGWIKDGANWYYLSNSGSMKTGWLKDGGSWYYLASSGKMKTGWIKDGGSWYYLSGSGAMQTGWIKSGSKWYYVYSSGKMAFNTKIGSYRLGSDGAWIQ